MTPANQRTLDLAPIGNCTVSALIDRCGRYVWACAPRVDGDPVFSALLDTDALDAAEAKGFWSVEVEGQAAVQQSYLRNTAVLRTVIEDERGGAVEILDFCPRYRHYGRNYRPIAFVRLLRPIAGSPRVTMRLRPAADWGKARSACTSGSNHIRFLLPDLTMRLTTSCPVSHILEERTFRLEQPMAFFLGPDEKLTEDVAQMCDKALSNTITYWREWVRTLTLPLDWQAPVIRAAITLKLCAYEETGAIVAALTTSIPEHADSGRNWDYRYCWIRDAYYVIRALNRLGATDMLENYLGYLRNLVDLSQGGHVQPVYGVGLEPALTERIAEDLPGYRGMGPVRVGNQAHEHLQHDVYGQIVLPLVQSFFDERLLRPGTFDDFHALEKVGDRAFEMYDKPDAGLWEFRTMARVHTYSSLLCWAACARLANAAEQLGLVERAEHWARRAATIRERIEAEAYNEARGHFAGSFGGDELDASLLQLIDLGFIPASDPRMARTIDAVETELRRGSYMFRYADPDDFGSPQTAFNFCTFWFIEALHEAGRDDEARDLYRQMLDRRTHAGLLSEDIGIEDGELWGNYPQTYSLVGLINCAHLLSRPWSAVR